MAQLPDPAELVEILETQESGDRLHTVVIRREFEVRSADGTADGTANGNKSQAGVHPGMHWQYQTVQEVVKGADGDPNTDVRIHIERAPNARFLWLVGPDARARVPLPEARLDGKIDAFRRRMLLGSGVVLALGLVLSAAVAHRVSAPLRRLASAAEQVGGGALGIQVDETTGDREVVSTLSAFNRMSSRLAELDARARKLSALRHLGEIGDVARGLAHTLRNPLNALGLSVEELASRAAGAEKEDSRALASSARRQIQRMDRGIRSFLVLASPAGSAAEPVDLAGLARDVALEALQDGGGRVRVFVEAEDAAPDAFRIEGVEAELRAVLQALVVNAVEASPDGGEVTVRVVASDGLRVEVRDRGLGLAPEVRERLFTPHVSTKANGSGMGLFLAHRLATQRYGGGLELLDIEEHGDRAGTRAVLTLGDRVDPEADPEAHPEATIENIAT
jgi:signal transduction histidine kinase